ARWSAAAQDPHASSARSATAGNTMNTGMQQNVIGVNENEPAWAQDTPWEWSAANRRPWLDRTRRCPWVRHSLSTHSESDELTNRTNNKRKQQNGTEVRGVAAGDQLKQHHAE